MRAIRDRPRTVDIDDFLAQPLFAHLATASDHGPRESPVWFLWEDGAVWIIASHVTDTFPHRSRDACCAIGVVDFDRAIGLVQHVGLRGRATVEPFDAGRARRLLARYLGHDQSAWDERFQATLSNPKHDVLIRFVPETVVAHDQSYERRNDGVRW